MDFSELVRKRHTTRQFSNRQVKDDLLLQMVNDARTAPSWVNTQERKVYVASKNIARMIREEYLERTRQGLTGVSDYSFTQRNEWSKEAQGRIDEFSADMEKLLGENFYQYLHVQDTLFDAPAMFFLTLPKNAPKWAIIDLGAFAMTLLLSAAARGLASSTAYAFVKYPDILRKHLPVSPDEDIVLGVGIGYPDKDAPINDFRAKKTPLNQIMFMRE